MSRRANTDNALKSWPGPSAREKTTDVLWGAPSAGDSCLASLASTRKRVTLSALSWTSRARTVRPYRSAARSDATAAAPGGPPRRRQVGSRARCVVRRDAGRPQRPQKTVALGQGLGLGGDSGDGVECGARGRQQTVPHTHSDFIHNRHTLIPQQQVVDGMDGASQTVFDGQDGGVGHPLRQSLERGFEGSARQGVASRDCSYGRRFRVRARHALVGDPGAGRGWGAAGGGGRVADKRCDRGRRQSAARRGGRQCSRRRGRR